MSSIAKNKLALVVMSVGLSLLGCQGPVPASRSTQTRSASAGGSSGASGTANAPPRIPEKSSPPEPSQLRLAQPRQEDSAFRYTSRGRVIAIGDVHGDLSATRAALRLSGAIDEKDGWVGGDLTLVQTGDQLDRGDDERQIVDLFERLQKEAAATGGQVIPLNGNHEIMNVQGDFRYVTPGGASSFAGVLPRSPQARGAPPAFEDRAAAFLPGGGYALKLAERAVVAVVDDSVFVHGGILPEHVSYGIARINGEASAWMRGTDRKAPASVANDQAPVWVRDYSLDPVSASHCATLAQVLDALGVQRMVVGHTTQKSGINSACGDRVYRIDVGLARYYGDGPIQVLEIVGSKVRVLRAPR
jgi:calcineurin-like phosphoesterase family protein